MCWIKKKIWCKNILSLREYRNPRVGIFFSKSHGTYVLTVNNLCSFVIIGICSSTRINVITMLRYALFYMCSDRIQPSCLRFSLAFSVSDIHSLNTRSLRWCDSLSRLLIVHSGPRRVSVVVESFYFLISVAVIIVVRVFYKRLVFVSSSVTFKYQSLIFWTWRLAVSHTSSRNVHTKVFVWFASVCITQWSHWKGPYDGCAYTLIVLDNDMCLR